MNKLIIGISIVALIVSLYAAFRPHATQVPVLGATNGDSTTFSNLILQTYTGATSTIQVGCIQALATSSATTIKLTPIASSTAIAPGFAGYVLWNYGTCP